MMHSRMSSIIAVWVCMIASFSQQVDANRPHHAKATRDEFHQPHNAHDTEHIKEDLEAMGVKTEKEMTQEELDFHYFKLHDYDNNTKLDGLEILKAITHMAQEHESEIPESEKPEPPNDISMFVGLIDDVLATDDIDGDGFLNFVEYKIARHRTSQTQ